MGELISQMYVIHILEAFLVRVSFVHILFGPLTVLIYLSVPVNNSCLIGNMLCRRLTKHQITGIREYNDQQRIRSFVQIIFIHCVG